MQNDRDGAFLAHIADTVTELREDQQNQLAVLARLVEVVETQTEMLAEILAAARQDAQPSDTAEQFAKLVDAVAENTEAVAALAAQMAELPAEIGAEVLNALSSAEA